MSGYYKNATICLNGHVSSDSTADYIKFCKECGLATTSRCSNCSAPIQGYYYIPGFLGSSDYQVPYYCHECGSAYPWTNKILENAVELVSLDDKLSEEHKTIIKNSIPNLIVDSPTTPLAQAKYKKYMSHAADYVQEGARNLLIDVVSESVKKALFS
ncbi:DUF2321 domain-containing protein [Staphylococcus xylosus]|uniref:DUF2321 domain-containing protein n=1 Tax=Staphylococcus xylosus TaxID=1288 RepID=UPI001C3EF6A2|nr:DUF2321 domain-containing protein [Staphylococcus xylosus]